MSRKIKKDTPLYDPDDYHKVECYVSNELYDRYTTETENKRMVLKSIRIEIVDEKIKIIYDSWENNPEEAVNA